MLDEFRDAFTSKKFLRKLNFIRISLFTRKLEFVSNILHIIVSGNSFFASKLPPDYLKLDLFDNLGNSKVLTQF